MPFFSLGLVKLSTSFSTFMVYIFSIKNGSLLYFSQISIDTRDQLLKNTLFCSFYQFIFLSGVKQLFFCFNANPCVGSFWIFVHPYRLFAFRYWKYVLVSLRYIGLRILIVVFSIAFHLSNPFSNIFFKHQQHQSMFVTNCNLN